MVNRNEALGVAERGLRAVRSFGWLFYTPAGLAAVAAILALMGGEFIPALVLAAGAFVYGVVGYFGLLLVEAGFWGVALLADGGGTAAPARPQTGAARAKVAPGAHSNSGLGAPSPANLREASAAIMVALQAEAPMSDHALAREIRAGVALVRRALGELEQAGRVQVIDDGWRLV